MQALPSGEIAKNDGKAPETVAMENPSAFTSPRVIRSILIFVVAGVVLYAVATVASDYRSIIASLLKFPILTLCEVLILVVIGWLLRGWRFYYYLKQNSDQVPLGYSIAGFLAGFALTGTPGKIGEAVKAVFFKQDYNIPVTRVIGIVMIERLMDLWGVLLLGLFSLVLFTGWSHLFLLCAAAVLAAGIFLCSERLYRPVLEFFGRISFLTWISKRILGILATGSELMTPRIFVVGLLVSSIAWGMESISLYLILDGLQLPSTLLEANFAYCFSTIVGALSMLPGGIGGTEVSMIGILKFMGISYAEGLPAVILIRVCTLWLAVLVGVIFMIILMARLKTANNREGKLVQRVPSAPFNNS